MSILSMFTRNLNELVFREGFLHHTARLITQQANNLDNFITRSQQYFLPPQHVFSNKHAAPAQPQTPPDSSTGGTSHTQREASAGSPGSHAARSADQTQTQSSAGDQLVHSVN